MRDIKFRGKTKLGDWLYGSLTNIVNHYQIVACTGAYMDVLEETIGQFTGLYDKNKTPIYEGDIVRYFENECAYIHWNKDRMAWGIEPIDKEVYFDSPYLSDNTNIEVIGNIYENSDLLGE